MLRNNPKKFQKYVQKLFGASAVAGDSSEEETKEEKAARRAARKAKKDGKAAVAEPRKVPDAPDLFDFDAQVAPSKGPGLLDNDDGFSGFQDNSISQA